MIGTTRIGVFAALSLTLFAGSASATPTQKCQESKLKAQGKFELCLKKNDAKTIGSKPDKSAKCRGKFQAALSKADQIAISAGTAACRYVDNGDGTVSDLNTGLVWEKKDNLDGVVNLSDPHDADNEYMWSTGNPDSAPNGTAFTVFLYGLNGGYSPDGMATTGCFTDHCDWRLPTVEELVGIHDPTQGDCGPGGPGSGPCIDPVFGPTQRASYWSATADGVNSGGVWQVLFQQVTLFPIVLFGDGSSDHASARAVRGGL
jgi:hypothetical protein